MSRPVRHRRFRQTVWLALLALWLQVLAPVLHDSMVMASTGSIGDLDSAHHLCVAPGSQTGDPASPDKGPAHTMPACAVCQAVHAVGGFAPPAAPTVLVARGFTASYPPAFDGLATPRWSRTSQQPRAPPALA